jgi:RNA polymerase sigma-70 factor (ECF subfamily)
MRELCDDELLTLAQARNEEAFAELMRRNSSSSFKLAMSILRDRQDAEDEVQNSYWNAWRYLGGFQRGSKFSTWMSRIVTNHCLMRLRKGRQASFLHLDAGGADGEIRTLELPDRQPTPEAAMEGRELSGVLRGEIRRLPPLMRTVLVLRDIEEMSMVEIAGKLGISVVAAKSRLLRARLELRKRMEGKVGHCGLWPEGASAKSWTS